MIYENMTFDEERALYGTDGITVKNCTFDGPADGESALKECKNLTVKGSVFRLRYPFWHVTTAVMEDAILTEGCRAALWYDSGLKLDRCVLGGIKALRECGDVEMNLCKIESQEFGWKCRDIRMNDCSLISEYPFFECKNMEIKGLNMTGKYSFQYVEDVVIRDSILDTKDAFWHSKNVTVEDSFVKGEYLGWYSENLKLVRCHIVGTQPLCYAKNLVLEDCTMEGTDLAFERCTVNATVNSNIVSVKNPLGGKIQADSIGEIIWEDGIDKITSCEIVTNK